MSDKKTEMSAWLANQVSQTLMISLEDVKYDANLFELGIDSQDSMVLVAEINKLLNSDFSPAIMDELGTIEKIIDHVVENSSAAA